MHLEDPVHDMTLSSSTWLPASARRLSQKVLLVLLSGRIWVLDREGRRHEVTGPTWVVWYPGERLEYGAIGDTVHWLVAQRTATVPAGWPRPGSLVRVREPDPDGTSEALGTFVHPIDESPAQAGPYDLVVDVVGSGIGIYSPGELVEVVEEADGDLHDWDFWPGNPAPVRRAP